MRKPSIQICNERFLSTFGVDRILLLAARHFEAMGAGIEFSCLRFAPDLLAAYTGKISTITLRPGSSMQEIERQALSGLLERWMEHKPDVLLIGGWPYFEAAARAQAFGIASIFIDAGAVPHDGMSPQMISVQQEVRRLRRLYLPDIGQVLPISDFIRTTQTIPDRHRSDNVQTVLLGSDHLEAQQTLIQGENRSLSLFVAETERSIPSLLVLGRYEPEGYKNSTAAVEVVHMLRDRLRRRIKLFVLGTQVPNSLGSDVVALGFPSDAELKEIMRRCDLGLSMSLWEGFNLPFVEMQQLGVPVLAFNLGAHPEVTADPWFLCADPSDMARKAGMVLSGRTPTRAARELADFPGRLPWSTTLDAWWSAVKGAADAHKPRPHPWGRRLVLIDVTNSCRDTANSGVVRVSRHLGRHLTEDPRLTAIFVIWDSAGQDYRLAPVESHLSSFGGPQSVESRMAQGCPPEETISRLLGAQAVDNPLPPVLFISEVVLDGSFGRRADWARGRELVITAIGYDLIPWYHPELCAADVVEGFRTYAPVLLSCDLVIAISKATANALARLGKEIGSPCRNVETVWLPAELGRGRQTRTEHKKLSGTIRILCVSTLEPRKNHARLIDAFKRFLQAHPKVDARLILIGNRYAGAAEVEETVTAAIQSGVPMEWHGVVSDDVLIEQYQRAHFTVYPSLIEGFGMPIMESLWMGKPCLCSNAAVMGELAAEGGCLAVDATDVAAISEGLARIAFDRDYYRRLLDEISERPLQTWKSYAQSVSKHLGRLANPYC